MRRLLRSLIRAFGVALVGLVVWALRLTSRRVGLVVVYHAVGDPQGQQDRELVPPHGAELFEGQVFHLKACYRAVGAAELLDATIRRKRGQRFPVAITFDDDLACHARVALPILKRVGVPATFFVCGASLSEPFAFWWERLQQAADRRLEDLPALVGRRSPMGTPPSDPPETIHEIAARIEEMSPDERDAITSQLGATLGPDPADAGMRSADLKNLVSCGMTIGFHTLRHDRLPSLTDDALSQAMTMGRRRLEEVAGCKLECIAYPHGRADTRVAAAARAAGFAFGFTGDEGLVRPSSDPLLLPRITPFYRSTGHFALQLVLQLLSRR